MRRWIDRLRLRLRSLLRQAAVDAQLQRELRFHLDQQIAEYRAAGLTPDEARAAALRAFGPIGQIEEECRDMRGVTFFLNLVQDLRHARRSLMRQPQLVVAATISIAIGVSANSTIFSLATELLLSSPTAYRADRLVRIRTGNGSHVSYRQWRDLEQSGALSAVAGYQIEKEVNWRGTDRAIELHPLIVTANYFDVIGAPVAMGRPFTAAEAAAERGPTVAVISHGFWQRRLGGDPSIVGRPLTLNGQPYVVVGVLPAGIRSLPGYGVVPDIYLPLNRSLMPDLDIAHSAAVQLVGRLRDGQSLPQGRAALETVVRRLGRAGGDRDFARLDEFAPIGGIAQLADFSTMSAFFGLLMIVVGLILLIACANVAGLLLARSIVRQREIAVRAALGASRARLVQQLVTEALWLALLGTVAGLATALVLMSLLTKVPLPVPLPIDLRVGLDGRLLVHSLVMVLLTAVLCALIPALQATRPSLVPALRQEGLKYGGRRWTVRGLLVIGQVAVSLVLLVTALLFLRNLARSHALDPGFDTAHTVVAQVSFVEGRYTPESRGVFLEAAVDRLRSLQGVDAAAYAHGVPLTIRSGMTTGGDLRAGGNASIRVRYEGNFVGPGYFTTMGIRLISGREFLASDRPGAPPVAIVNGEFARRYLAGSDPIGQHIVLPGSPSAVEIVGVVANGKHRTLGEDQQAAVYEAFLQRGNRTRFVHILVHTIGAPDEAVRDVEQALSQMDSSAAVDVQTMRSTLAFAFLPSQAGAAMLGTLGTLGLALAMVGLYAVMSYSISRRTAEIGLRMALGASERAVMRLVFSDASVLAGSGILSGLAVAALITRPLAMFLVAGLSPTDPVSFAGTAILLGLVSFTASWSPARRAMRIDPVVALRHE
jgi:predicted permease